MSAYDWFLPDGSVAPDAELLRERPFEQVVLLQPEYHTKSPAELRRRYNQPWRDEDVR